MSMVTPASDATLPYRAKLRAGAVVGRSVALARALHRVQAVAHLGTLPVLLTGESGTGKSLFARVIHQNSPRRDAPLVEVNCAAIPSELWEAEFFGAARNAYTQATSRCGRFAAAEGGTLFLDEIGEIPPEHQAKLLRVLDQGCYERLGEDHTRRADVRIVAATNRDLEQEVRTKRFRPDLFFRLDRFRIHVPSLDERRGDVPELARVLVDRECKSLGLPRVEIADDAMSVLRAAAWPGNVRQLQSVIAQALIEVCAEEGDVILPDHLRLGSTAGADGAASPPAGGSLREATRDFKRRFVHKVLCDVRWNRSRAAQRLGLSRSHLYSLMHDLGIERERP